MDAETQLTKRESCFCAELSRFDDENKTRHNRPKDALYIDRSRAEDALLSCRN